MFQQRLETGSQTYRLIIYIYNKKKYTEGELIFSYTFVIGIKSLRLNHITINKYVRTHMYTRVHTAYVLHVYT